MTINEILKYSVNKFKENNIEDYMIKAKMLVSFFIEKPKEYLITHDDDEILDTQKINIENGVEKIIEGTPIQYITNKQEFMKLNFFVDENVLIPRADTEILVQEVIEIAGKIDSKEIKILDLCTGSGAIAISLAKYIENAKIAMSDISKNALDIALKNLKLNADTNKCKIILSDLFENINENFNIIVSNPPYIKTNVIETLAKDVKKEPYIALNGGIDGLDIYRKIINDAYEFLECGGYLCLEIGYDQKEDVIELIEKTDNYKEIYAKKDLAGNDRIIICRRK